MFYKNRILRFECQMMFIDLLRFLTAMVQWYKTYMHYNVALLNLRLE